MRAPQADGSCQTFAALLGLVDALGEAEDVGTVRDVAATLLPSLLGTDALAVVLTGDDTPPLAISARPLTIVPIRLGTDALGTLQYGTSGRGISGRGTSAAGLASPDLARLAAANLATALVRIRDRTALLQSQSELGWLRQELAMRDAASPRREAVDRRFLMEAGTLLASSLDFEKTLARVADLAVPELADWCAVRLLDSDGVHHTVAIAHADPNKVAIARQFLARNRSNLRWQERADSLAHMPDPLWVPDLSDPTAQESLVDPESPDFLARLGVGSLLTVALRAHGEVLGTLSLAHAESGRRFRLEDLELAQKLADRAGIAVDNARLYGDAQRLGERLRMALKAGRMGSWDYDADARRIRWSADLAVLHDLAPGEGTGSFQDFAIHIHPEDRKLMLVQLGDVASPTAQHPEIQYRVVQGDGTVRWMEGRGQIRRDTDGHVLSISGLCLDITRRKEAEEALAAERERLAVTLSSIGDAVITTDMQGCVLLLNRVAESLTRWTLAEAAGRRLADVFAAEHETTGEAIEDPFLTVFRDQEIARLPQSTVLCARDGTRLAISANAAPIRDREGLPIGVVLVFRDITHTRRMEAEMAKASKLESIGVLAGGIAHDFNNILTPIVANLSLIEDLLGEKHPAYARILSAERACDRARDLSNQLLTFARGGAPVKTLTPTLELLREACGFALQGSKSRAEIDVASDVAAIVADPGQISQVVHNLVLNADQAMPSGGMIWVTAENISICPDSGVPVRPGPYVRISVRDEGPGIAPEIAGKLFDPFVTTKPTGTGLGLATAYSILQRHDGHIAAESEAGVGATFTFHVPRIDRCPAPPAELSRPPSSGRGRVLVMDDDAEVRALTRECLQALGYTVETAVDGRDAVNLWETARADGTPFGVAIMDLTIPGGMGGREALARLQALDPCARAIVASGYCEDPVMAAHQQYGFVGRLQKPYGKDELARVLHDVLPASD